jgi:hypothetical protein
VVLHGRPVEPNETQSRQFYVPVATGKRLLLANVAVVTGRHFVLAGRRHTPLTGIGDEAFGGDSFALARRGIWTGQFRVVDAGRRKPPVPWSSHPDVTGQPRQWCLAGHRLTGRSQGSACSAVAGRPARPTGMLEAALRQVLKMLGEIQQAYGGCVPNTEQQADEGPARRVVKAVRHPVHNPPVMSAQLRPSQGVEDGLSTQVDRDMLAFRWLFQGLGLGIVAGSHRLL